jgi:hypothetical protein
MMAVAARRDASWFRHPSRAGRYHIVSRDGVRSACGIPVLDEMSQRDARDIPEVLRCKRSGCRSAWPKGADDE